jgi:hypothetical protein
VVLALLALVTVGVFAQTATDNHTVTITIAPIAAMALENGIDIPFSTVAPGTPGDPVGPPVGTPQQGTDRLFYTALNDGSTRHITVETNVAIPPGTRLNVVPVVNAGAGTAVGTILFSNAGATATTALVTAIGSVATGTVSGTSGTGLTYNFWVFDASALVAATTVVTVTYTLTDDIY